MSSETGLVRSRERINRQPRISRESPVSRPSVGSNQSEYHQYRVRAENAEARASAPAVVSVPAGERADADCVAVVVVCEGVSSGVGSLVLPGSGSDTRSARVTVAFGGTATRWRTLWYPWSVVTEMFPELLKIIRL